MIDYCPKCGKYSLSRDLDGAGRFCCLFRDCNWTSWRRGNEFQPKQYADLYPLNKLYGELLYKKIQIKKQLEDIESELESIKKVYSEYNGKI